MKSCRSLPSAAGASRVQIQAIFDNSPDWLTLFRATADGRFVYADLNRATERAYGLSYDQAVGRTVEEILGPEQAELPLRLMRACIRTGENQRYNARRTSGYAGLEAPGADEFPIISKPFRSAELSLAIARLIGPTPD